MKIFKGIFLVFTIVFCFVETVSAQVAYEVQTIQTVIAGPKLQIDFQIRSTGATPFVLGTSTFFTNYNVSGLSVVSGSIAKVGANDGPWSALQDDDYAALALNKGAGGGYVGLTVVFNGGGTDDNGLIVPGTFTTVGRLTIAITNAALTSQIAWRNIGSVTQVLKVTSPGVATSGACDDITNAPSFLTPIDAALPVELTSFNAIVKGRNVELSWKTATETNNSGFEVERKSVSSTEWSKVSFVEGNGTSNAAHSYTFTDAVKAAGKYSYRLKQIDRDGKFEYSQEVEAVTTLSANDYALSANYPNPFNPSTKFTFAVKKSENVTVKVFNALGQDVATLFNGMATADNLYEMNFNASGLASGTYFYMLRTNDRYEIKKMLLMK